LTEDAGINYHLYYGPGRNVTAKLLRSRDIVITTYQTLSADLPSTKTLAAADGTRNVQGSPTKTGLFAVKWKRVVLDEGHTIRNPKSECIHAQAQP
jgi:SWI/SNF-related matrix-associated actin-dependent regulator of chromatin subfamily A3